MAFFPAIAQPTMKKITGSDDVAFAHFGTVGYVISAGIGRLFGKNSKSTEEMEFPQGLPNAKPALDRPVVFPYAPNAVLIGFLSSFVGGIIGMIVLILFKAPVILPGVVPHFFCGATAGVFGNATGGKRGAFLGALVHGIIITFLPVLLMPVLGNLGFANTTFSDADFSVVGILLGNGLKLLIH